MLGNLAEVVPKNNIFKFGKKKNNNIKANKRDCNWNELEYGRTER